MNYNMFLLSVGDIISIILLILSIVILIKSLKSCFISKVIAVIMIITTFVLLVMNKKLAVLFLDISVIYSFSFMIFTHESEKEYSKSRYTESTLPDDFYVTDEDEYFYYGVYEYKGSFTFAIVSVLITTVLYLVCPRIVSYIMCGLLLLLDSYFLFLEIRIMKKNRRRK